MRTRFFLLFMSLAVWAGAQNDTLGFFEPSPVFHPKRACISYGLIGTLGSASLVGLGSIWYRDYSSSSFHFFNDNGEWLQMDKAGHLVTSYTVGRYGMDFAKWSGDSRKRRIGMGFLGFGYLACIEVLDGFSSGWGFSPGDLAANSLGTGLLIGQELLWQEQRIVPKFGFRHSGYAQYRSSLLGSNFGEQLIKDYNGQTYWLSVNIASFLPKNNRFPEWLNLAVGYGANGMVGGHQNPPVTGPGGSTLTFERYRQFYLSPDIDLTRLPVRSHFLKAVFGTFGFLKIPAPGIELSRGKLYAHWLSF